MKNESTMSYTKFRREFALVWENVHCSNNEINSSGIYDVALESHKTEPTYRSMLSACWAEYKRRNA